MREKYNPSKLYVLVTNPTDPEQVKPDVGFYSPKELAAKEGTTQTSVYKWIKEEGLPHMRQGKNGNFRIYYQDYIQWMIDCARAENPRVVVPSWAFRFVRDTSTRSFNRSFRNQEQISLF